MSGLYNYRSPLPKANGPCMGCTDRHAECHGKCEKYLSFRKERDEDLLKRQKHRELNDAIIQLNYQTHESIRKQMNKRK